MSDNRKMLQQYRVERWTGDSPPSAIDLKRAMEAEGFDVFQWSDPPGATYSPHVHNEDQSHWIVSGNLELNVAGHGTIRLSAGDRDFMPADTEHSAAVAGDESVVYLIGSKQ
jgi:quercetin dioxygenase-like cupin family protein